MSRNERIRLRAVIRGAVQGVGFRPFIYRLATGLGLAGWVNNSTQGVFVEVEGARREVEAFLLRLEPEKPPQAFIQSLEFSYLDPVGYTTFEIRQSDPSGEKTTLVLPDLATCADCLRDVLDPNNRRYRYPFTNCTNCGPRFSIIEALPYDRPNTTMKRFVMCHRCRAEYDDPLDRRFHAQPNACPDCGPLLELCNSGGKTLARRDAALHAAEEAIRRGAIVAVKGLGGFHLMADARSEEAVLRLRRRKHREEKPLAVMVPSPAWAEALCSISPMEARLLRSVERPIVLLRRKEAPDVGYLPDTQRPTPSIAASVAPGNPTLGLLLPYAPLHYLLLTDLNFPVIATSGNLSDEPICTEEREALERLGGIADLFLVHNRPIARHVDDSVARVILDRELVMRRARGYAPLPVSVKRELPAALAVGAHLKNTVALSVGRQVFLSQHIGDLETAQAFEAFRRVGEDLRRLYDHRPEVVACDLHPDYLSTQYARQSGLPLVAAQHHVAHVLACMAENELEAPVLGVSWDGTGYGTDGTVWGGEFLLMTEDSFERVAHLRPFRLPGGEKAVKEPRRSALGLLYALFGDALFSGSLPEITECFTPSELDVLRAMLQKGLNAPITSSAGRLFDAVAALIGLHQQVRFEGQAAMELEYALHGHETDEQYGLVSNAQRQSEEVSGVRSSCVRGKALGDDAYRLTPHALRLTPLPLDWAEMIRGILADKRAGIPNGIISSKFHNTLVEMMVTVAKQIGVERVALTGGCFQNRYLTERAVRRLQEEGFRPYWHQRVPPNDGGIALGQIVAAARAWEKG